jgi:hypothetical protein
MNEADTVIDQARNQIEQLEGVGENLGLSRLYLEDAERFFDFMNPIRAMRAANDAVSEFVLGLDGEISLSGSGVFNPYGSVSLNISLTNSHDYGVQFNVTPFIKTSVSFGQRYQLVQVGPESSTSIQFTGTASSLGYTRLELNFKDFNVTSAPGSFIVRLGGIISNISVEVEEDGAESLVTIRLLRSRADSRYLSSPQITYDDGTGEQTLPLENYGDSYGIVLGPYSVGTNITYQISISDILGNIFILDEAIYSITAEPVSVEIWMSLMIGAGLIGVLFVVIIIVRRRRMPDS